MILCSIMVWGGSRVPPIVDSDRGAAITFFICWLSTNTFPLAWRPIGIPSMIPSKTLQSTIIVSMCIFVEVAKSMMNYCRRAIDTFFAVANESRQNQFWLLQGRWPLYNIINSNVGNMYLFHSCIFSCRLRNMQSRRDVVRRHSSWGCHFHLFQAGLLLFMHLQRLS